MSYSSDNYAKYNEEHNAKMARRNDFNKFTQAQMMINVNELVNAELYNRVSLISCNSIKYLKQHHTPQEMRGVLLATYPYKYCDGKFVKDEVTAPRKENRGISNTTFIKKNWNGNTPIVTLMV